MSTEESQIQLISNEIQLIITEDSIIEHCRINIINGAEKVFQKYQQSLATIKCEDLSIKCYKNHKILYQDLFSQENFMSPHWFNLFVFNIGKNGTSLDTEVGGVEMIMKELSEKFDSRFYSAIIVSPLDQGSLSKIFEKETGEDCPIDNYRYLGYDFDGIEIVEYLRDILHTHSSKFLKRWAEALNKLEDLHYKPLNVVNL